MLGYVSDLSCKSAQMGTLSADRCSKAEADRAALTATASSAATSALNRDAARIQAVPKSASSTGGAAVTAAQQSDGSQAEAMAAAGDEMQVVHPEQPQEPKAEPQLPEQTAAESQPSSEPAEQVPLGVADSQDAGSVGATDQGVAGGSQTDSAAVATETVPALASAASVATTVQPEADPVDTNGAQWDSQAAAEAAGQPELTQPAATSLMLGSREARQQSLAAAASEAGGAAVSGQSGASEAEALGLVR